MYPLVSYISDKPMHMSENTLFSTAVQCNENMLVFSQNNVALKATYSFLTQSWSCVSLYGEQNQDSFISLQTKLCYSRLETSAIVLL